MIQLSNTFFKSRTAFLRIFALCALMMALPEIVDARGARASGGFSRNSPASSGSISSRSAVVRRTDAERKAVARQLGTARDAHDPERPRASRNTADLNQSTQSVSSPRSAEAITPESRPVRDKPVSAKEMAAYREQFKEQNKDRYADKDRDDDWDDNWHGEVERPVAAAVVVGAAATVRRDAYLDYVHEDDDDDLAYYSELPCSLQGVTAVNDVTYYVCEKAWYVRGYESGSVVYIKANPPAAQ